MLEMTIGRLRVSFRAIAYIAIALVFGGRSGFACYYSNVYNDNTTVYSSMTTNSGSAGDWIRATITLTSPDNRQASDDTGDQQLSSVTANANLDINFIDGTYSAVGGSYEYYAQPAIYQGGATPADSVPKFIQIVLTQWSAANFTMRAGGTDTYTARVRTSSNCVTNATVEAGLTAPTGMIIGLQPGSPSQQSHSFAANDTFNFSWTAQTDTSNTVNGDVTGSTSWVSNSAKCTQTGPDPNSGFSLTKSAAVP